MTINGLAVTVMVGLAVCGKLAEAKTLLIEISGPRRRIKVLTVDKMRLFNAKPIS